MYLVIKCQNPYKIICCKIRVFDKILIFAIIIAKYDKYKKKYTKVHRNFPF